MQAPEPPVNIGDMTTSLEAGRRARRVFVAAVVCYGLTVALLAAFGLFGFIWKTVVVPALFIIAALLGRLRSFVRDWAVFLAAILLFDSLRGLIFALINRFELPVYMVYAIDWERALLGGETLPEILQRLFMRGEEIGMHGEEIGLAVKFLVVVHASHFLFFLFFGLFIWLVREEDFGRFKLALTLLMYTGLGIYLAVPTVPPWMAAAVFEVLPPIRHVTSEIYNLNIPTLKATFDSNPIAAMPSLHAAFPTLLALISLHHFKRRGWLIPAYAFLVYLSITVLGEHYVVDVFAGMLLAAVCYWAAYRTELPRRLTGHDASLRIRLLLMVLLLLLAEGLGLWARKYQWHYQPTEAFVARELDGHTHLANYYRGRRAYLKGDHQTAQAAMELAIGEVTRPSHQENTYRALGISAFHNGDWQTSAENLGRFPLPTLGPRAAIMLAQAQLKAGLRREGFATLDQAAGLFGDDPGVQYWKDQLEAEHGRGEDPESGELDEVSEED